MNDKLKSILHTAWTEPRHFFFWLATLSICGFVPIAVGTALEGGHPKLFFSFVMLGCVLCFAASLLAFILAWIPLVRRLFSWVLRRKFLVLGCLVTLIALFYAIEDWRGRRAWQNYKQAWEAKGERFDLAGLVPPPVPNDQNFFETPLWSDLHFVKTNDTVVWRDSNQWSRVIFDAFGPEGNNAPSTGSWIKTQHADLAAWQAFYRGSNNLFAAKAGPPTNYFPIARAAQTPAADVLLALSRFDGNRQLLIAAAARPEARFWVNYDEGFAMLLPHLARVKGSSRYLSLHATAALKAGDLETALEDIKLSFRLIESIRSEPTVISHLVRIAMLQIALQPVWEGLADRQWTEAELRVIESELGKLDFLADYRVAMRGERACNVWAVDYVRKADSLEVIEEVSSRDEPSGPERLKGFLAMPLFHLIPSGWFDQNKLSLCRLHEKYLLPLAGDQDRRVVLPAASRRAQSVLEHQHLRPYDTLSRLLLPALAPFAEKCARGQTFADLARVACALERYRMANGQFPETLEALAPKFIANLPHDLINGQPLKYRRTDDGQFVLYSVGWNQTDDGGQVGLNKNGNPDWHRGDWVWHYPAK